MRRFAVLLGALSAALGTLVHMPTRDLLFIPQMIVNEFSWIPALLGGAALSIGSVRRSRSRLAMTLGAYGLGLSVIPFLQVRAAIRRMDIAMREGLGDDYGRAIPKAMQSRVALRPVSVAPQAALGGVRVLRDITYAQPGARPLRLDVLLPLTPPVTGDCYPAILSIHGGSWRMGNKGGVWSPHNRWLAAQGYVIFDIQYRFSHEDKWPAQLDDVRAAIRWVKANAPAYRVDPSRLALFGRSAGGHLALSAAYRASDDHADTSVSAVVAIYPPTDLRLWEPMPDNALTKLIGGMKTEAPDAYADASPIEFVRAGAPPTLMVQGDMDNLVLPAHCELLEPRLSAVGTPAVTLRIPWSRHGFDVLMPGLGAQIAQYQIDRFLAWSLYREATR